MASSEPQVILQLASRSQTAESFASTLLVTGLNSRCAASGECHELSTATAELAFAGVPEQNSILPGEVVC